MSVIEFSNAGLPPATFLVCLPALSDKSKGLGKATVDLDQVTKRTVKAAQVAGGQLLSQPPRGATSGVLT
ncbi:MAG: hypothetical protein WBD13_02135, partial [Burkholderiaceae bacterium]